MENLRETLEAHKEEYLQYLKDVIEIDTQDIGHGILGGLEKKGQDYIATLFKEMGADSVEVDDMVETTIEQGIKKHGEGNLGHDYKDRYNVYATFKGESDKSLMFNGHMDTMPPGDIKKWNTDPHVAEVHDGKLYGLGAADMKGGLMASTMAVKLLKDAGINLPLDVVITSVCDEEGGGNGSILAAMNGKKADGVVVCEGTSDELILAHMGFVFFEVKVAGKSNHSGAKWLGVSAIDKAIKIIHQLEEVEHSWLLKYKHPLLPAPNLNVGVIKGGTAGSTVAGDCMFQMCVHYLPEIMSREQVIEEVSNAVERTAKSDVWLSEHPPTIEVYQAGGAFEMGEDTPFVDAFKAGYKEAMKRNVKIVGSPAGCDSRIWKNVAGCPTIQFGPGNLEQCHSPNEYLELDAYWECILIYAELILAFGKQTGGKENE